MGVRHLNGNRVSSIEAMWERNWAPTNKTPSRSALSAWLLDAQRKLSSIVRSYTTHLPNRTFHNFRASHSADPRILCSLETSIRGSQDSKDFETFGWLSQASKPVWPNNCHMGWRGEDIVDQVSQNVPKRVWNLRDKNAATTIIKKRNAYLEEKEKRKRERSKQNQKNMSRRSGEKAFKQKNLQKAGPI